MRLERLHQRTTLGLAATRNLAALLFVGAASIHFWAAPEHLEEWWGYGWFFLTVAVLQGLYAVILVAPKGRLSSAPWYLIMGGSFNLWLVGFYTITRTAGIPLFGPHAGHVEGLGVIDMLSKTLELGSVAALSALLFWHPESRTRRPSLAAGRHGSAGHSGKPRHRLGPGILVG